MRRRSPPAPFVASLCAVLASALLSAEPAASPQGSIDASFESGGTGWTLSDVVIRNVGSGAFHGVDVIEIDPGADPGKLHGFLEASFPTTPGQEYRLTFAYQAGFAVGTPEFLVTIDGAEPQDVAQSVRFNNPGVVRTTPDRLAWSESKVGFYAQHAQTLIRLGPFARWNTSIGWGCMWLDYVRVESLGRTRTFGRDLALRATLPSTVLVGEPVELTLSLVGMRRTSYGAGVFDTRPMRFSGSFNLSCDDPLATKPAQVTFQDETTTKASVSLGSPGVWRFEAQLGGYEVLSNPVLVSAQPLAQRAYWGDVHIHTEIQHANWEGGTGAQNYAASRDFADLDFAALSEHYSQNAKEWMDEMVPPTVAYHQPGQFVTFVATENGFPGGHINYYLKGGDPFEMFDGRNSFTNREALWDLVRERNMQALIVPHHFLLLDPMDWRSTDRTRLRLAEIYSNHGSSEEAGNWWRLPETAGNNYSDTQGAKGHDFRSALARGHRLGVIGCSDSHQMQPGLSGLTCVRANSLEREALWNALYQRDCYATSGDRILLDFQIGAAHMGQSLRLASGAPLNASVEVHGQDVIAAVEFVRDGQIVQTINPGSLDATFTAPLGTFSGQPTYVYVRVRQANQHRAWSSPIWIDPLGKPDLVLESGKLSYDRGTSELVATPWNFGDVAASTQLCLYSSASEPSFAGEGWLGSYTQPTLLLRLEPVNANRVRLKAALYTPTTFNQTFFYSGEIRLWNATGHRVVTDPRGMLVDDGLGTLSWNDLFGYRYLGVESKAGQLTDIEIEIDTQANTTIDVLPRVNGAPLAQVLVGSQVHSAPLVVSLPVGLIASTPPLATVNVLLPRNSRATGARDRQTREVLLDQHGQIRFPALPPGATYVVVLDPSEQVVETSEDNNAFLLVVPETATPYSHWTDYLPLTASSGSAGPGFGPTAWFDPNDPCGPPVREGAAPLDLECRDHSDEGSESGH